ncbi:tyrosine-type recombinase/integrase [Agromyces protaetiae]|nr:tyrosine-type recombinase/integrase [Agromyces protaetiae]
MRESISPVSRALTLEQIGTLLGLIPDGVYRRYFAALVYTGMSAGEATALRVGDIDFGRGVIRVNRSLRPGMRGELVEQMPKSHKSRDLPLIDTLRPFAEAAARGEQGSALLLTVPMAGVCLTIPMRA